MKFGATLMKTTETPSKNSVNYQISKRYLFPIFLILFILITLYSFIFGGNGFFSHREKLQSIAFLEKENKMIKRKVRRCQKKIVSLQDHDSLAIEKEARNYSLIKRGDIVIKLANKKLLEQIGDNVQKRSEFEAMSKESVSLVGHYKMIIGIIVSLVIAFLFTIILPWKNKESNIQENS